MSSAINDNLPETEVRSQKRHLIHRGRSGAQADLYALNWRGTDAVLKDFSARPAWIRLIWGRPLLQREARALRRLGGVEGVPRFLGWAGPDAFLMERVHGKRIPRRHETPPPEILFDRLTRLINTLHEKGIGHGDIRRTNVLMDNQARPYLIDFATAIQKKKGLSGIFSRFMFRRYALTDRYKAAGIKADFYPEKLSEDERDILERPPWYVKYGRLFRKKVFRYTKSKYRRRLKSQLFGDKNKDKL